MGIFGSLGGLVGSFLGAKDAAKNNKLLKSQLKEQSKLTDRQVEISKYIEQYAKQAAGMSGDTTDFYGTTIQLNPATGKYEMVLGGVPRTIQDASDREELNRNTTDQAIRQRGLQDYERMRGRSVDEAGRALDRVGDFRAGIGKVDPGQVGSQLRADRTRAVNAGYDDAERAAQTLQLRTGSSAVGDALNRIATDRVRAQANIGSPEVEALQLAEGINNSREGNLMGQYQTFGNEGRAFYDAGFSPSNRAGDAYDRLADLMKFDLSKLDLAMGGNGQAASTIGNAQRGQNAANASYQAARTANPWGQFASAAGGTIDSLMPASGGFDIAKIFGGM